MRHKQSGITLIELMVVVVIVGILTGIAYPSYRAQVMRSNRSEAKIGLEEAAQAMEKCFTRSLAYDSVACNNAAVARNTAGGRYNITATVRTPTAFTLQAAPLGAQVGDAECMNFTITEAGAKGVSGSLNATPERCW